MGYDFKGSICFTFPLLKFQCPQSSWLFSSVLLTRMHCKVVLVLALMLVLQLVDVSAARKKKEADPKDCEVCINNLNNIEMLIPKEKKHNKEEVEKAISTHCTLSGFGSDWRPNPTLTNPKDVKMCYIFEPIKKSARSDTLSRWRRRRARRSTTGR